MSALNLPEAQTDALLNIIKAYRADPRPNKIDLGVGVYRDEEGNTPVMTAVKKAEKKLLETQASKAYLGLAGDLGFVELLGELVFGKSQPYLAGLQSPGGTGGLRVAFELYKTACPDGKMLVGTPTWPNHMPLLNAVGIPVVEYPYYDVPAREMNFDAMLAALDAAAPGDGVLLHGCCHNPTGADLSFEQWQEVTARMVARQLVPVIDCAYHGLGDGLAEDLNGLRHVTENCEQVIVIASCSKNFGLYRDRVGCVFLTCPDADAQARGQSVLENMARRIYSMPPDHGAAVVRLILEDDALRAEWEAELKHNQTRVNALRQSIADAGGNLGLGFLKDQRGMFSTLPLSKEQVDRLAKDHAVYMAGSGRVNIAGCREDQVEAFITALKAVM
jgi:aromatic-amino-acid transaminase